MINSKRLSEALQVVATADPKTYNNAGPATTDAIDMSKYRRVIAILLLGDQAAADIDFKLESDIDGTMDGQDVTTVVAATQLSGHAANNDNKQIVLECHASDLTDGHRYVRAEALWEDVSPDTGGPAAIVVLGEPWYSNEADLSSVVEIKAA